jgi:hypothetical protein
VTRRDWYEAEEPTRFGMITELQRLRRRAAIRPLPVLLLAAALTTAVAYKVITKKRLYTADVVLAVNEGALSQQGETTIPFEELKEHVATVLLPDTELKQVIERHFPGRLDKVGNTFALLAFRDRMEITIWKNTFVYFRSDERDAQKSARIGIEIADDDPDRAYEIARELGAIAIRIFEEQRRVDSQLLSAQTREMREVMLDKLDRLSHDLAVARAELDKAHQRQDLPRVAALSVDLATLESDDKRAKDQLHLIDQTPDELSEAIAQAGLDTRISIVDAVHPERTEQSGMLVAIVIAVIGVGSLVGSALVLGAFDSRVHEIDDVARLDLPVLGHLPGFAGDHVGSLEARGIRGGRVPSSRKPKWR